MLEDETVTKTETETVTDTKTEAETETETKTDARKYRVLTVEKSDPPEGMQGDNWCRYVIQHGNSTIDGIKPGSVTAVTEHAETFAEALNSRRGKGGSTYAPRKKV